MVKEVLQPPKYQCEHCNKIYSKVNNAQRCEAKGLPEFKYRVGDEVETIIQLTKMSGTRMSDAPIRLFDIAGGFAKVKVTDRYYFNHTPVYAFEHPQIQGQYWRYPEIAFELPDEMVEDLREPIPGGQIVIEGDFPGNPRFEFDEKVLKSRIIWSSFEDYLRERKVAVMYGPEIVAEPINPR